MTYSIVIPAHNEESFIGLTLDSVLSQTVLPKSGIVVDDNSTDATASIVNKFADAHPFIQLIQIQSDAAHLPGSKVINAFNTGIKKLTEYDVIVKLDADLILPPNYFESVIKSFESDAKIGMVGGFAYIEIDGEWILENLTDKDHIRGAFKAYRKECFDQIGGLKPAMGWDTVDELLAKYHGWKVITIQTLKVKHLKPTGKNYNKSARFKQGEAFFRLGYGLLITTIASAKLAIMKKKPMLFFDYIRGFLQAKKAGTPMLVTSKEAEFIRSYRLKRMRGKLF